MHRRGTVAIRASQVRRTCLDGPGGGTENWFGTVSERWLKEKYSNLEKPQNTGNFTHDGKWVQGEMIFGEQFEASSMMSFGPRALLPGP